MRTRRIKTITDKALIVTVLIALLHLSCREDSRTAMVYKYVKPEYKINLCATLDTIDFLLDEHTYNDVGSFNYFIDGGSEYISFYDKRSQSVNIYDFRSQRRTAKLLLKKMLPAHTFSNTSVYVNGFHNVFVNNKLTLYKLDTSGSINDSIDFQKNPYIIRATFDNTTPPVFKDRVIYTKARPYLDKSSLGDVKKWKTLYSLDLENNKLNTHYQLPEVYQKELHGLYFFDYGYCINGHGNFVFSFPADSNIYETDLREYHVAYYGKSRIQKDDIKSITKKEMQDNQKCFKNYIMQNSYGPVYFDPLNKRYLRVVKCKIEEKEYALKNWTRQYRLIIFDEHFHIIGESPIENGILYTSLFFTKDGSLYARVSMQDENALRFVRLNYREESTDQPINKN